jgi:hypothetical protein
VSQSVRPSPKPKVTPIGLALPLHYIGEGFGIGARHTQRWPLKFNARPREGSEAVPKSSPFARAARLRPSRLATEHDRPRHRTSRSAWAADPPEQDRVTVQGQHYHRPLL